MKCQANSTAEDSTVQLIVTQPLRKFPVCSGDLRYKSHNIHTQYSLSFFHLISLGAKIFSSILHKISLGSSINDVMLQGGRGLRLQWQYVTSGEGYLKYHDITRFLILPVWFCAGSDKWWLSDDIRTLYSPCTLLNLGTCFWRFTSTVLTMPVYILVKTNYRNRHSYLSSTFVNQLFALKQPC
jgi:hypothetical protein